ncbi:hypothetical protein A0H81_10661 [Grifola frondosa]|uniref:DUF6534 domain-containing protein n=1 Tax=Grifola frondosa TaxID=5627 RepID=A0A1C7LXK7_GRIFR|nr:hypothetical protein A0H81_10661 [Grifola frondosa]
MNAPPADRILGLLYQACLGLEQLLVRLYNPSGDNCCMSQYRPGILKFDDRDIPCALSLWFRDSYNNFYYLLPEWAVFRFKIGPLVTLSCGMGSSACIDVIVASVMIYYLKRGRSALTRSDNMLVWLSVYTVNTGALTSAISVLTIIMFAVQKESLVFLALGAVQSKLYANSFLGSLNDAHHALSTFATHSARTSVSHDRALEQLAVQDNRPGTVAHGLCLI